MKLSRLGYLIKSGFTGIFSHGLMSFATVTITMACLIIMGSFGLLVVNINALISDLEDENEVVAFIDEYLCKKGMHVQFNIMSADKMRDAQKKPENYKDMLVRVAGYSAYFVELGKPLQDDLIDRTEFHF